MDSQRKTTSTPNRIRLLWPFRRKSKRDSSPTGETSTNSEPIDHVLDIQREIRSSEYYLDAIGKKKAEIQSLHLEIIEKEKEKEKEILVAREVMLRDPRQSNVHHQKAKHLSSAIEEKSSSLSKLHSELDLLEDRLFDIHTTADLKEFNKNMEDLRIERQDVLDVLEPFLKLVKPNDKVLQDALAQGAEKLETVRLMALGESRRGKTATIASLCREPFRERESTMGIDIITHYLVLGQRVDEEAIRFLTKRNKFRTKLQSFIIENGFYDSDTTHISTPNSSQTTQDPNSNLDFIPASTNPQLDSVLTRGNSVNGQEENADPVGRGQRYGTSKIEGNILRCWDFGGQREYEIAHEMFLSPRSIAMVVFNLVKFEDQVSRDEEIRNLCNWVQTICACTRQSNMESVALSILLVGTHRDGCKDIPKVPEYLTSVKQSMASLLDGDLAQDLNILDILIFAIENRTAVIDPVGSGLGALESFLSIRAKDIVAKGPNVPLRWIAYMESLQNRSRTDSVSPLFLTRDALMQRMHGFCFPRKPPDREKELTSLLLYYRNLGEIIIFNTSRRSLPPECTPYVVFLHPEKILMALKKVVAPIDVRLRDISNGQHRSLISKGIVTMDILRTKWEHLDGLHSEKNRLVLAEMLTALDLFIKLNEISYGVPALRQRGWNTWGWMESSYSKRELSAISTFQNYVPMGLIGMLVARMYRSLHEEGSDTEPSLPARVRYVCSNGVLLTLMKKANSGVQVFVGFDKSNRMLIWKIRSDVFCFQLLGRCFELLEQHLRENANTLQTSHFLIADCLRCSNVRTSVKFPVSDVHVQLWLEHKPSLELASMWMPGAECENENFLHPYSLMEALRATRPSQCLADTKGSDKPIAFVSHAGPDKEWAVYLARALEKRGIRSFVDRLNLKGSNHTAQKEMEEALATASIGVFVLSPEFYCRESTIWELITLLKRKEAGQAIFIYPLFFRLSFKDAKSDSLFKDRRFHSLFIENCFFDPARQEVFPTRKVRNAMQKLCKYSGLERKLKELHTYSQEKHPMRYRANKLMIDMQGSLQIPNISDLDVELGGVTFEDYFDFAAARIDEGYQEPKTKNR